MRFDVEEVSLIIAKYYWGDLCDYLEGSLAGIRFGCEGEVLSGVFFGDIGDEIYGWAVGGGVG